MQRSAQRGRRKTDDKDKRAGMLFDRNRLRLDPGQRVRFGRVSEPFGTTGGSAKKRSSGSTRSRSWEAMGTIASSENPVLSQASMSPASSAKSRRLRANQRGPGGVPDRRWRFDIRVYTVADTRPGANLPHPEPIRGTVRNRSSCHLIFVCTRLRPGSEDVVSFILREGMQTDAPSLSDNR